MPGRRPTRARRTRPARRPGLPRHLHERWTRTYTETAYEALPWFSADPAEWVVEGREGRWWPQGARLLDIGCGAGTNALYLARAGYRVSGIDLAAPAIEAARRRAQQEGLSVDFRAADVLRLPFGDATFAGALDIGCFHTIPPRLRPAYRRELARVLRPGATFALSWIGRENEGVPGPPHRPSLEEVTRALEAQFLFHRVESRDRRRRKASDRVGSYYVARLERRRSPQPVRR